MEIRSKTMEETSLDPQNSEQLPEYTTRRNMYASASLDRADGNIHVINIHCESGA